MATATVTSKGQITIPKKIRDALGVVPGDRVVFERRAAGEVVVTGRKSLTIDDLYGMLPNNGVHLSIGDIDEAIGEALAEDDDRIRGQR